MSKWLLRWYWTLFAAPIVFVGVLAVPELWLGPNAMTRLALEWFFQAIVVCMFALSLATLAASLAGFRAIARRFGAPGLQRWPLYAGLVALTVGALLSSLLYAVSSPLEARAAGRALVVVRS